MSGATVAAVDTDAALLRAESDHVQATVHALLSRLSAIPGLRVKVLYRHGRLRRLLGDLPYLNELHRSGDAIRRLEVSVEGACYWLECEPGLVHCGRDVENAEPSREREELTFASWANELFAEISHQSHVNHDAMFALRRLVEQGQLD
jgi:hypothetical protein